jgi:D-beta-D-heptose 7-phosphate kinase/D-beta-D-heptose 1-phosphate adenosyltransferase
LTKIFVNGTFDIVHRGHLELLNYARSLGTHLLVAIDADRRVKELKGSSRPINNQADRVMLLESLRSVDEVCTFDSDEELQTIIKNYKPDIMVKGSDYRDKPIIGSQYCKEIKFVELVNGYSTTNKIQDIINR